MKTLTIALALSLSWSVPLMADSRNDLTIEEICGLTEVECQVGNAGVVIGRPGTTNGYAQGMEAAAKQFKRYFGQNAPQAAVVLGEVMDADIRSSLLRQFPVVLPWLTIEDRRRMVESGVRRQIRAQYPDLEGEQLEATVKRSVDASLSRNESGSSQDMHQGVYAHELGHLFFINSYWPSEDMNILNVGEADVMEYGGPAPDWLDEMAAVLMENEVLTESRRTGLAEAVAGGVAERLWSLDRYLSMIHPAFEQARAIIRQRQQSAEGRAQGGVVIMSSTDLNERPDGISPVMFYSQSRGFADFMIEKTGNQQVFADIAKAYAAGGTLSTWLAKTGEDNNVPTSVETLEKEFHAWLEAKYAEGKA